MIAPWKGPLESLGTLIRPRSTIVRGKSGEEMILAPSTASCVQALEAMLVLLQRARSHSGPQPQQQRFTASCHSGPPSVQGTLDKDAFDRAWTWLKKEFENRFMTNEELWERILDYQADRIHERKAKETLRQQRRGAFQAFFNSLCSGNAHFGRAVLRHGFSTPRELQMLLKDGHFHGSLFWNRKSF